MWEEGTSVEELPILDWPVPLSLRHFSEVPAYRGWCAIPRQLGLGYVRKTVEQVRGKQTSKHTFSTASVSDHASSTLPSVPACHPLVMECDPGIVGLNKAFPPQVAFGPGVYITATGSK